MCSVHMYALGMVCQDQKWPAKMHNWLRSAEVFEPFEIRPQLVGVAGRDCRCLHCLQDGLLDSVQLRRICERHLSVLRVPSGDRTEVSEVKWSEVRQRPSALPLRKMNAPRSTHLRAYQCLTVKLRTKPDVAASMDVATVITFHAFHAHTSGCARFTFSVICWLERVSWWRGVSFRWVAGHGRPESGLSFMSRCHNYGADDPHLTVQTAADSTLRMFNKQRRWMLGGSSSAWRWPAMYFLLPAACADNIRIRYFLDCYRKVSDIATIA